MPRWLAPHNSMGLLDIGLLSGPHWAILGLRDAFFLHGLHRGLWHLGLRGLWHRVIIAVAIIIIGIIAIVGAVVHVAVRVIDQVGSNAQSGKFRRRAQARA
eukprot:6952247-Pyramimonas_sp.AAC.1